MNKIQKIGVIGAGFTGLVWAQIIKNAGYQPIIFDKNEKIGGVWYTLANEESRVQIVETEYRFDMPYHDFPTNFTPKNEIASNAEKFIKHYNLNENLFLSAEVTEILDEKNDQYKIKYTQSGESKELIVDAIAYLPGSLSRHRTINIPNEHQFKGTINYGISNNINVNEFKDKTVLIIGMGAFAIENARMAFYHGAKKVYIIARNYNLVVSRHFSYKMGETLLYKGTEPQKEMEMPYELIDKKYLIGDACENNILKLKSPPACSDFFFIATYYGFIEVINDECEEIYSDSSGSGVILRSTKKKIPCDMLVKCLGFEYNEQASSKHPAIYDIQSVKGIFVNNKNNFVRLKECTIGTFDMVKVGVLNQSFLNLSKIHCYIFLYYLKNKDKFDSLKSKFNQLPEISTSLNDIYDFYMLVASEAPALNFMELYVRANKIQNSKLRYSEKEFLEQNKAEWDDLVDVLMKKSNQPNVKRLPYPYRQTYPVYKKIFDYLFVMLSKIMYKYIHKKYIKK